MYKTNKHLYERCTNCENKATFIGEDGVLGPNGVLIDWYTIFCYIKTHKDKLNLPDEFKFE